MRNGCIVPASGVDSPGQNRSSRVTGAEAIRFRRSATLPRFLEGEDKGQIAPWQWRTDGEQGMVGREIAVGHPDDSYPCPAHQFD
jgi:hypothetical protein